MTDARPPRPAPQPAADPPPSSAALRALDRLVASYGVGGLLATPPTPAAADGLQSAVRLLCAEAQRANPGRAERMVIALHAAWPTLPAVQRLPFGDGRDRLLERIVTLAIAGFYETTPGTAEPPARGDGAAERPR